MKPIRILQIASGDLWGGAEAQVYISCTGLHKFASEQINASCFVFNKGDFSSKLQNSNIETKVSEEKLGFFSLIKDAIEFAKDQKTDILISHGYKEGILAWIISKSLNVKWVHYIHGTSENLRGIAAIRGYLYSFVERVLMRYSADRIVCVSKKIAKDLDLLNLDKLRVIHNSAEVETCPPEANKNKKEISICWLGRLAPIKRPDIAILSFQQFLKSQKNPDDFTLNLYGIGPLMDEIIELKGDTKNINICGFTNNPYKAISNSDLVLLTSDSEGIPTVLLEALHAKVPIISRIVGGIPEIIENTQNCAIVKIKDASTEACKGSIEFAIENLNDLKTVALKCNSSYFAPERMIRDQIKLLQELC